MSIRFLVALRLIWIAMPGFSQVSGQTGVRPAIPRTWDVETAEDPVQLEEAGVPVGNDGVMPFACDYAPTGLKRCGIQTRAVNGHELGLKPAPDDKRALIAFLKTLRSRSH